MVVRGRLVDGIVRVVGPARLGVTGRVVGVTGRCVGTTGRVVAAAPDGRTKLVIWLVEAVGAGRRLAAVLG